MPEPIHIEPPKGQALPRDLESKEKGALWLVALHMVEIRGSTGYGEVHLIIHQGEIDRVERVEKQKTIPEL